MHVKFEIFVFVWFGGIGVISDAGVWAVVRGQRWGGGLVVHLGERVGVGHGAALAAGVLLDGFSFAP